MSASGPSEVTRPLERARSQADPREAEGGGLLRFAHEARAWVLATLSQEVLLTQIREAGLLCTRVGLPRVRAEQGPDWRHHFPSSSCVKSIVSSALPGRDSGL